MFRRLLSCGLAVGLVGTTISVVSLSAQAPVNQESARPQASEPNVPIRTMKDAAAKFRAQDSNVRVLLRSKAICVGRVVELGDQSFVLKDEKGGHSASIQYDQVEEIGLFRGERKPHVWSTTGDFFLNILTAPLRMLQCLPGGCC